jgi:small subunit ribosomal protein S15
MMISKEAKEKIIKKYGRNQKDSGSVEVQIAITTERITNLSEHLKTNKKDHGSRRGLLKLIARRKSLLSYLSKKDYEAYVKLIKKLKLKS